MQGLLQKDGTDYSKKLSDIGLKVLSHQDIKETAPQIHELVAQLVNSLVKLNDNLDSLNTTQTSISKCISKIKEAQSSLLADPKKSKTLDDAEALHEFFELLNDNLFNQSLKGEEETLKFDEIIHLLSTTSTGEPEWLSRSGKILVADPNTNTLQALDRRLNREGHRVICSSTIEEVMEQLQKESPDTVIIDNTLLVSGTTDFISKVQDKTQNGYIPIIVIGPMNDAVGIEEAMEAGASDYLSKPVNPILLRANVRSALEKKSAYEQRQVRLKELENKKSDLERAINNMDHGFAVFDQNHKLVMHNDQLEKYYPHLKDYLAHSYDTNLTFRDLLQLHLSSGIYSGEELKTEDRSAWIEDKISKFTLPTSQWEETLLSGKILEVSTYRTPDGGGALITRDVTDEKAQHQDLAFRAYHDPLTGLANRASFMRKLAQLIESHKYPEDGILAVMFLDLDGFKNINDTYGHETGDWLLVQVANRLRRAVRGEDVVARLGGDEFCIILTQVMGRDKTALVANRILKMISENFLRNDQILRVGVSIGISLYPETGLDSESLVQQADEAMYEAKRKGKGTFYYFSDSAGVEKS